MAFTIGGKSYWSLIEKKDFIDFFSSCEINQKLFRKILEDIIGEISAQLPSVLSKCMAYTTKIEDAYLIRCGKVIDSAVERLQQKPIFAAKTIRQFYKEKNNGLHFAQRLR